MGRAGPVPPAEAAMTCFAAALVTVLLADPLTPGDHARTLEMEGRKRTYLVHIPPGHDPGKPAPVILVLHGADRKSVV